MSHYDYMAANALRAGDPPFYALIMAAVMKADTLNAAKLAAMWPEVTAEVQARWDAPGGVLPGEAEPAR